MLFGLRQLTIRWSFISYNYTTRPEVKMTQVCLALSSASNLKDLIITNLPDDTQSISVRLYNITSPIVFVHPSAKITMEGGSPALHSKLEASRRRIYSHPDLTTLDFGTVLSKAVHILRGDLVGLSTETTYMIGVAMHYVQETLKSYMYCGDVRELNQLIAILRKLDDCVVNAEAEVEDL